MTRLVAALCLALAAPAVLAADDPALLYGTRCTSCHGPDGKGSAMGKKLGAPDLTKTAKSKADLAKIISEGKGKMTAYKGKLTPEQIDALAGYVKTALK